MTSFNIWALHSSNAKKKVVQTGGTYMRYHAKMTTIKNCKPLRNGQTYGDVKVIFYIVWSSFLRP